MANVLKFSMADLATSSGENVDRRDLIPVLKRLQELLNNNGFFFPPPWHSQFFPVQDFTLVVLFIN